jgi:peptide/nickel transport system permease protein
MVGQMGRRLALGAATVLVIVTGTFLLINLSPGDPARYWAAPGASAEELANARRALGLDLPVLTRYVLWLGSLARGDWGLSLEQQRPVTRVIAAALPGTLTLTVLSLALSYVLGIAIGFLQAMRRRTALDTGLTVATVGLYGVPAYWLAIMLVLVFTYGAARWGWPAWLQFPAMGASGLDADLLTPFGRLLDHLRHLALPLATLTAIGAAGVARYARASVLEVRGREFVRAAAAKGVSRRAVAVRHVFRNALTPIVTLLGLSLPALFSGTVFVEVIFAWPGMGRVMVQAVTARDYPLVMATTAIFAMLVVVGNILADLGAAAVDPRLRRS